MQIQLLERQVYSTADHEAREAWVKEILVVLEPCASQCQDVALMLTRHMRVLCDLLFTCDEPLCLSSALDIFEEVVAVSKKQEAAQLLAEQGVIGALVNTLLPFQFSPSSGARGLFKSFVLIQDCSPLSNLCVCLEVLSSLGSTLQPSNDTLVWVSDPLKSIQA